MGSQARSGPTLEPLPFVYPPKGPVSEDPPVREVLPILRSALAASAERFTRAAGWHSQQ